MEKIDQDLQKKLVGKRGVFDQPPGMGRMASDLLDLGLNQIGRVLVNKKKVDSIKKAS